MPHRNTIFEEQAGVIANVRHPGDQFILRLKAPKTAKHVRPGQFVNIRVSPDRPLRRPISIMCASPEKSTIDLLVKTIGKGTDELSQRRQGERLSILGPIGRPFDLSDLSRRYVCIGGGVGIPPMIFTAQALKGRADVVVFAGSEVDFPFALKPAGDILPGITGNAILAISSLEEWGVPSRLASSATLYGCYDGYVTSMAVDYLSALEDAERKRCIILACGPHAMLHAVARLCRQFLLPGQVCLEEYMACGLGGCAGCVVKTVENGREYYRRVCVDGPVFPVDILPGFS